MRRRVATAAVLAALVAAAPGCHGGSASGAPVPDGASRGPRMVTFDPKALARLGVKVEEAGSQAPSHQLQVPGSLDYNLERYAEVGTLMEGRVTSLAVKVGDTVRKGQPLATLLVPSIANAQADFLRARAALDAARKNEAREQALLAKDLTTAREAELARSEVLRAEADQAAATARLSALGMGQPASGVSISGAGSLSLASPIAGVVVRRDAVMGKFMAPNESAFVVADLSELWASLEVYESDMPYLRAGADVDITVDAIPGKVFEGKLSLIEPQIGKASRAVRARVVVPNPNGALRPGFFVRASIGLPAEVAAAKLLVPSSAVQPLGDSDVVFVERFPGAFEVRAVRIARRTAEVVEIGEGLSRGERIAVGGAFLLRGEVTKQ